MSLSSSFHFSHLIILSLILVVSLPSLIFYFFLYTPLSSSSHLTPRRSQRGRFFYSSIHHRCQAAMLASIQKQKPKGKMTIMRKKSREFKAGLGLWLFGNKQTRWGGWCREHKTFKTITLSRWCSLPGAPPSAWSRNTLKATLTQQQLPTSQHSEEPLCLPSHWITQDQPTVQHWVWKSRQQLDNTAVIIFYSCSFLHHSQLTVETESKHQRGRNAPKN